VAGKVLIEIFSDEMNQNGRKLLTTFPMLKHGWNSHRNNMIGFSTTSPAT